MAGSVRARKIDGLSRPSAKSFQGGALLPRSIVDRPVATNFSTDRAVSEGYKMASWVYACARKRAESLASVPAVAQRRVGDDQWETLDPAHPLSRMVKKPNPKTDWGTFVTTIALHLDLGGNAVTGKVRARGKTVQLWNYRPDKIKPVPSKTDFISRYEYDLDGRRVPIPPEDIIHTMYVDPSTPFWGISPLMAGGAVVDMEVQTVRWNRRSVANRAVPDGILSVDMEHDEEQFEEFNRYLDNQLSGERNAHRPIVMGSDAKYTQLAWSPKEMDYNESRLRTREEICGIFAVPPPLVGIYDNATLANIETARTIFWLDGMVPLTSQVQNGLNAGLEPDYGPDVRILLDVMQVQAVQQALFAKNLTSGKLLFDMGVPFKEINRRLNLNMQAFEGDDVGYVPATLVPSGSADGGEFDGAGEDGATGEDDLANAE